MSAQPPYPQDPRSNPAPPQTPYAVADYRSGPPRPVVAAGRLWATGAATALVAALAAVVFVLLARGVLDIPLPTHDNAGGATARFALGAAVAALAATGVLHVLLLTTATPRKFFHWIVGLATVAFMLLPFTTDQKTETQVAMAAVSLLLGIVIGSLLSAAIPSVLRRVSPVAAAST